MNAEENPRKKFQINAIKSEHRIARILQITARIIAGIGTLAGIAVMGLFFALFLLYGSFIGTIFFLLILVSAKLYTTSLKEELVGGLLLVGEAVGFLIYLLLFVKWISGWDLFVTLLIAIPLTVSGILFIIAWYLEKYKKSKS